MDSLILPPEPTEDMDYDIWRKDVLIWSKLTNTPKIKRGRALQYTCRNYKKIHEIVLDIDDRVVDCKNGLVNVLKVLDAFMKKSNYQKAIDAFEKFMKLEISSSQSLEEFFYKFDLAYKEMKNTGSTLNENLLFHRFLKALKLPDLDVKIIKANVSEFTCSQVKQILRKMYTGSLYSPEQTNDHKEEIEDQENNSNLISPRKRKSSENYLNSDCFVDTAVSKFHSKSSKVPKFSVPPDVSVPRMNPCHKCFYPHHWNSICDKMPKESSHTPPTVSNTFITSTIANHFEDKCKSKSHVSENKLNKEFNDSSNYQSFHSQPKAEFFNEAVILDVAALHSNRIFSFVDLYSKFSLSTTIENMETNDLMQHIKELWINIFGKPCAFLISNSTILGSVLKNIEDCEILFLCLEDSWVKDQLDKFYTELTDIVSKIVVESNCGISQAVFWGSSILNKSSTSGKSPPALCAFGIIPLLPCIGNYRPPQFHSETQYCNVINTYIDTLKIVGNQQILHRNNSAKCHL